MERDPSFFVMYLMVPVILMTILSVLVFVVPAGCGERIGLSITILLSYGVFLLMTADVTPTGGEYTPALCK